MKLAELAAFLGGTLEGDPNIEVSGIAKIEEAKTDEITFISNPKYEKFLSSTKATSLICSAEINIPEDGPKHRIRVPDPYNAFLFTLERFNPPIIWSGSGIHSTAQIDSTAQIGKNVTIGQNVVIYKNAKIGDNTVLHANCVVGPEAQIGNDCLFYPNVTVYHQVQIHHRVIVHSGAVIGSDGFGVVPMKDGSYRKIPPAGFWMFKEMF